MKRNLITKVIAGGFFTIAAFVSYAATVTTTSTSFEVDTTVKLIPESANWSEGSITLWFTDGGVAGSEESYVVYFRDASAQSEDGWEEIPHSESERMWQRDATGKLTLTDPKFATRLDGIPPVEYLVVDANSVVNGEVKISASCITRMKFGVFVGLSKYNNAYDRELEEIPECKSYAEKIARLAKTNGRFLDDNVRILTDDTAKSDDLEDAFDYVAEYAKTGDICLLYFMTHGGGGLQADGSTTGLALYDAQYSNAKLLQQIERISGKGMTRDGPKGVAVVGFVHACESATIGLTLGSLSSLNNTAWITSSYGTTYGNYFSISLLDYGWENGWAGDSGQPLTCESLAEYTKKLTDAVFDGVFLKSYRRKKDGTREHVIIGTPEVRIDDMYGILGNITIGTSGTRKECSVPDKVNVIASKGESASQINLTLSGLPSKVDGVEFLFLRKCDDSDQTYDFDTWGAPTFKSVGGRATIVDTDVTNSSKINPFSYQVRVINGAGVSVSDVSDVVKGWRSSVVVTFDANGGEFFSDGSTTKVLVSDMGKREVDFSTLERPISPIGSNLGFKSWDVHLSRGDEILTDHSLIVPGSADVEYLFKARWVEVCDVVYVGVDGSVIAYYEDMDVGIKLNTLRYPLVLPPSSNMKFGGWWTQPDGRGVRVDNDPNVTVKTGDNRFYVYWEPIAHTLSPSAGVTGSTSTPLTFSQTYTFTSYLQLPDDGGTAGTMTVKTQKEHGGVAAATVTIQTADGTKQTIKGTISTADGTGQGALAGLTFTASGVTGTLSGYSVDGAIDASKSKDTTTVAVLNAFKGKSYVMALEPESATGEKVAMVNGVAGFSIVFSAKGKAKVTGTMPDGTKVSVSSQLIVGSEWCCLPVVYSKTGNSLAFLLWFDREGNFDSVSGMTTWKGKGFEVKWHDDVAVSKVGNLSGTSYFNLEESPTKLGGTSIIKRISPINVEVTPNGAKWDVPKSASVKMDRSGTLVYGANPSALKLTYKAKTGTFSGSVTFYTEADGRLKKIRATVNGVVVDGVGYGTALVKKEGVWPVVIGPNKIEVAFETAGVVLPSNFVGEYTGFVEDSSKATGNPKWPMERGTLTMSIGADGATQVVIDSILGKVSFSAKGWDSYSNDYGYADVVLMGNGGEQLTLSVRSDLEWYFTELEGSVVGGIFGSTKMTIYGARNRFADSWDTEVKDGVKAFLAKQTGSHRISVSSIDYGGGYPYNWEFGIANEGEEAPLTLTIDNDGTATVSGTLSGREIEGVTRILFWSAEYYALANFYLQLDAKTECLLSFALYSCYEPWQNIGGEGWMRNIR